MGHRTLITVRFCETDALGHVNNVSYLIYAEQARVEFLKSIGSNLNQRDYNFVIASIKCDYLAQAYFDQTIRIETQVEKIGNKSFSLSQEYVDNTTGRAIAKVESTLIFYNVKNQQSEDIPAQLRERLETHIADAVN